MPRHAERLSRRWAIALVAPLLVASCGGDDGDEGSDAGGLAALVTTTTTVELSSSETEPPTSTTVAPTTTVPERLEEDDLRSLLLQPGDVPEGLIEEEFEPSGEFATDPPACGEVTGTVRRGWDTVAEVGSTAVDEHGTEQVFVGRAPATAGPCAGRRG